MRGVAAVSEPLYQSLEEVARDVVARRLSFDGGR
jgi:hypothetical protein